jgi:tripartite-type tricarboxylate transporter receptor subunit TctC
LAVADATRIEALPEVPTIGEFVPGYKLAGSVGIAAPSNTPTEIIGQLNSDINACLAETKIRSQFAEMGAPVLALSSSNYANLIKEETESWGEAILETGIKPQ